MILQQKILIVDDKQTNLYALENVLKDLNVGIVKAENGNDALIATLNYDFSLAILDVQMPEMDGYELAELIRSEEKTQYLPIIFLSAVFSDDFHVFKGYRSGAVDFITKPFNPDILLNKVKVFLELDQQKLALQNHKQQLEQANTKLQNTNLQLKTEIAERKKAENLLRQSEQQLRELNATKDKFFSIVAHDLKNPFNTLIGFSKLLLDSADQFPPDKRRDFYNLIYKSSKRGYNLLENLLEWSRAQTGRIQLSPTTFDLSKIAVETAGLLNSTAQNKKIELHNNIPQELMVYADINMMTTVLRNLISNALKFTTAGGKVTVSAMNAGEFIEVAVTDTGIGIKEENQKKLFRIDQNYSTTGTAQEEGTGLGLILCKEFIEKNNGRIWIESEYGKGSSFKFTLPVAPVESAGI